MTLRYARIRDVVVGALVVGSLSLSLSGCTRSQRASGGGEQVDFCAAYKVYDELPEPSPARSREVTQYADSVVRVVDRVDAGLRVDDAPLPQEVVTDLATLKNTMRSFKAAYQAAGGDPARRRGAEAALTADAAADSAGQKLTAFFLAHCRRKTSVPGAVTGG
jgi:hypothetical protein